MSNNLPSYQVNNYGHLSRLLGRVCRVAGRRKGMTIGALVRDGHPVIVVMDPDGSLSEVPLSQLRLELNGDEKQTLGLLPLPEPEVLADPPAVSQAIHDDVDVTAIDQAVESTPVKGDADVVNCKTTKLPQAGVGGGAQRRLYGLLALRPVVRGPRR